MLAICIIRVGRTSSVADGDRHCAFNARWERVQTGPETRTGSLKTKAPPATTGGECFERLYSEISSAHRSVNPSRRRGTLRPVAGPGLIEPLLMLATFDCNSRGHKNLVSSSAECCYWTNDGYETVGRARSSTGESGNANCNEKTYLRNSRKCSATTLGVSTMRFSSAQAASRRNSAILQASGVALPVP